MRRVETPEPEADHATHVAALRKDVYIGLRLCADELPASGHDAERMLEELTVSKLADMADRYDGVPYFASDALRELAAMEACE